MEAFSFDPFDRDVFRILMDAQSEARMLGAGAVGTDHLLLAATTQKDEVRAALESVEVREENVRKLLRSRSGKNSLPGLNNLFAATAADDLLPFSKDTERALRATVDRSKSEGSLSKDELIPWKELMLSVLQDDQPDTAAISVLAELGVSRKDVVKAVKTFRSKELVGAGGREGKADDKSTLAKCSTDLTAKAAAGELDPCVGRDPEVRRCMQILVRRRKNNPVLLGDPGVGKTAVAEGIAQAIVDGKVPPRIKGSQVLSLELGLLVADTKYRGEFEQRLREVIDEVTKNKDIILFIDELHTLVGAGAAEGAIDAANLLKPALARGELQCIGATTMAEYRKYIEKDAALERRFQPVSIDEPTVEQTVEILGVLSERYAEHHEVVFEPDALEAAAKLSNRYVADRFLPDKAIDLMDEAGALVQIEHAEAMELLPEAEAASSVMPSVSVERVASVVSQWTGIPLAKLTADDASAMLDLEDALHERVIGQGGAVSAIARALRRARVGLRSQQRPVASMIFCGPTGVGKTELTKAVASLYYGAEKAMVRLDMSEYMSAFSVSRLTGPPPGYVGYEEGGQLTDAVRRTPHTVVLFDEVEKAHPDVFNVLLQVLDDGRLTDNKGRTVDFSNAMIVLTSNVGSRRILELAGRQGQDREAAYRQMRAAVKQELGTAFRPEFLNRLDEVIVFESLQQSEVEQVAELMLADLRERCEEEGFGLNWTPKVKEFVARNGASSKFGARPLRRAVQRYCEDAIAQAFLEGFIQPEDGDFIELDVSQSGNILLRNSRGQNKDFVPQSAQGIEDDEDGGDGFVDASGATTIDGLTGRVVNDLDADRPLSLGR